ncbi:unnamed protein product [Ceutorhynchus assimilis]|uniref:Carboxylic ester hydrolase n=1 Tax=Ceutorhynchus assimilis TaxID=467358 RepID=A0A9N9MIA7_9CUCU|nr:unnamed protein product [Ceutorhynchus assimilis]
MKRVFIIPLILLKFCDISCDDTLVTVKQGTLRGSFLTTTTNFRFRAFQGIPYAAPPIGSLRFLAPEEPRPWKGILDATKNTIVCYTLKSDTLGESEDCLHLNVYTPVLSNRNATKLPVLLWIHGGGFSHGNALYSNFGPDFLIEKDIVIVTISYRLGPFGFLAAGDTIIPGNAGLKDQAAAIKWTFENIESFGGDPSAITIAGQSAGASSVGYQLLHEKNKGLFRGAVLESGTPLNFWSYLSTDSSRDYVFDLAKQINASIDFKNSSELVLEFLQNVDAEAIKEGSAYTKIARPLPVIEPIHDNAFLTESQYQLLKTGDFIQVPILIGTNSEEEIHKAKDLINLKKELDQFESNPEKFIPSDFVVKDGVNRSEVGKAIRNLYLQDVPEDSKMGHIVKYLSHFQFTTAVIKHADLVSNYIDVFFYVFSYDGPMGNVNVTIKGADKIDHAEDPKYLFLKFDKSYSNTDLSKFPESDIITHKRLISLWSNFVKYLHPTPEISALLQNITWPKFKLHDHKYVDIGRNLEVNKNPKSPYYKTWVEFYENWAKKPFITF